jgi:hypothetical protein
MTNDYKKNDLVRIETDQVFKIVWVGDDKADLRPIDDDGSDYVIEYVPKKHLVKCDHVFKVGDVIRVNEFNELVVVIGTTGNGMVKVYDLTDKKEYTATPNELSNTDRYTIMRDR